MNFKKMDALKSLQAEKAENAHSVQELVADWRIVQKDIWDIQGQQDELFFSEQANTELFYQLDGRRDALRVQANQLIESICGTRAETISEVHAKIGLWSDIRYPDGTRPTGTKAVDQIALSAFEDLERIKNDLDSVD